MKAESANAKFEFVEKLYSVEGWVCLEVPKEISAKLGRGRVPVTGTINGYPIRTSIFPMGNERHMMMVNKQMQKGANVGVGDKVKIVLEVDKAPRVVQVPEELQKALSKRAEEVFDKLPYSHKKRYVDWIMEAKKPETRAKRVQKAVDMLEGTSKS